MAYKVGSIIFGLDNQPCLQTTHVGGHGMTFLWFFKRLFTDYNVLFPQVGLN